MMSNWQQAQQWEKDWWGSCTNTFGEEMKQLLYANRMGLVQIPNTSTPYRFDMGGKSILDIGGGPCSLLLKCDNVEGAVVDPLNFPSWVEERYEQAKIKYWQVKAEDMVVPVCDEAWIYNCLQHTEDPERVVENARGVAKLIRIFEWVGTQVNKGHPHVLTEEKLNEWLDGEGKVEELKGQNTCWGRCFYGVFPI